MAITITLRNLLCSILFLSLGTQNLKAACEYQKVINGEELSVGVMLHWATRLEKENAMFIIERSEDGIQFTNIGAVKGAGFSTDLKEYSFLDNSKPNGQHYYRLRQIDYSGVFSTSSVFIFNTYNPKYFAISTMSNSIATDHLEIDFDSFHDSQFEFELSDWQGNSLLIDNIKATKGSNTIKVDLSAYGDLIYKLTLRSPEEEQVVTFRKKQSSRDLSMKN